MVSLQSSQLAFVIVVVVLMSSAMAMRKQGVAVKGKFLCGTAFPNSTKVRIVDIDSGPDPDDTLDEKMVDAKGEFMVNGYTREMTSIDPMLYVWTDCNKGGAPCHRKIKFVIPKKFIISEEPKPTEWFDIGTINLQSSFEKEKNECIF